jgi:hypothetical protein
MASELKMTPKIKKNLILVPNGQFSTIFKKLAVCRLARYVALAKTNFYSPLNK